MRETDIRPAELFAEYLWLCEEDARTRFPAAGRIPVPCPACGESRQEPAFDKLGFRYASCPACGTLYLSPRPPRASFEAFYRDSPAAAYWAEVFLPAVAEARRARMFEPRARDISALCEQSGCAPRRVVDVGAGHGIFLEEWRRRWPTAQLAAVEPGGAAAEVCRGKGIEVLQTLAEDAGEWAGTGDLVTCFEVIEHAHEPLHFVRSLLQLARPGGRVLVSGLGVDGFDIAVLWERSNSVFPPHHINFMSVQGFETLFRRAGFEQVEVLTPGKLDGDIVRNALAADPALPLPRFVRTLLSRGEACLADFQDFLVRHRLSSHCWVWARRPE